MQGFFSTKKFDFFVDFSFFCIFAVDIGKQIADMKDNKTQKKILAVAEEEFLLKGFSGVRIAEIAERAGVSHSMLHYYFRTKEELFDQVMNSKMTQLQESLLEAFQTEGLAVEEKIVEMIVRNFNFLCQNPDLPRFVINEVIACPEYMNKVRREWWPLLNRTLGPLQRDLDAAARRGEVRKVDADTLLMDILSVNCFTFIVIPILATVNPGMNFQAFYNARCQENVQLIMDRICLEVE